MPRSKLLVAGLLALASVAAHSETARVAVAANFLEPMRALEAEFESASGNELTLVSGSTGQLYAQIVNGAPFDVLLAADQERPKRLVDDGLASADSLFTYAIGQLALWTRDAELGRELSLETLRRDDFRWLAIANPDLAPYGLAARQVLERMDLWDALQRRIVRGSNITQAFAMAETGNAELALIALSQAASYEGAGVYIPVPSELHEPIRQDAVLLVRGARNASAVKFMRFLRSPEAAGIIEGFGYRVDP